MPPPNHPRSKTCTCNNCVYKTRTGSLEDILSNGSKIDNLYYNKFLPLRERKLLEKLVRTRAIYDDVRRRILSGSNIDVTYEENLKNNRVVARTDDTTESNTLHTLVNLVDRGELPRIHSPVNLHNECCTCCSCTSKIKLANQPKVHMHIPSLEHVHQYLAHHKKTVRREKKAVRYRSTISDPCMCTLKFHNKQNKIHRERKYAQPRQLQVNEDSSKMVQKQRPKVRHKEAKLQQEATKHSTCECVNPIGTMKKKMRESMRSSVTKIEKVFRIKKDSLALFREKLRKKQAVKYWACDPGYCIPDECIPHECYDQIKTRHLNLKKRQKNRDDHDSSTITLQASAQQGSLKNVSLSKTASKRARILLKSSQASHKLNRCFCTLQLTKPPRKVLKLPSSPSPKHSRASFTVTPRPIKSPSKANDTNNTGKTWNVKCLCEIKPTISTSTQSSNTASVTKQTYAVVPQYQHNLNLLPYECEPLFCIPDACDPLLCKDGIRQRNFSHTFPQHVNMAPVNKKAKMTSASATKTPPRSVLSRAPKYRKRALKPTHKETTYSTPKSRSSPNAPTRQVVRIGSSFRFDIEFFKDRNHPDTKKAIDTNKKYEETSKIKITSSTSSTKVKRTKSTGAPRKTSLKKLKTKYADIVNEPLLKRCICTLKLLTAKQKMKAHMPFLSKETMATKYDLNRSHKEIFAGSFKSRSSMTTAVVNYVIRPQNFPKNLLPYECEPYFCTPGQCDPYVCEKRIKMRNETFRSRETNTGYTPTNSVSSVTSSVTSRSAGTYPTRQKQRQKRRRGNYSSSSRTEPSKLPYPDTSKSSISASRRQAVKIGSSFRFDIEFSKNRINTEDKEKKYASQESTRSETERSQKREKIHRRDRRIGRGQGMDSRREKRVGGGSRPHMNTRMSQSSRSVKSRPTATENFLKRCFCTLKLHKMQHQKAKRVMTSDLYKYNKIPGIHTQTRELYDGSVTYVRPPDTSGLLPYECEPNFCVPGQCNPIICEKRIRQRNLLKRCFCTLKFHSPGVSSGSGTEKNIAPVHSRSRGTETTRVERRRNLHKLLPYECEPGVCVPDQCDPYECQKRIERRNMQSKYAHTDRPGKRSAFSGTSMNTRTQDSQSSFKQPREKRVKTKNKQKAVSGASSPSTTSYAPSLSNKSRQAVKLSSQISFNIEFYKNKRSPGIELHHDTYEDKHDKKQKGGKKGKAAYTQGFRISRDRGMRTGGGYHSRNSQADSDRSDKSTFAESRPDRCFCTLKLHKNGRHQKRYEQAFSSAPRGRAQQVYYLNNNTPLMLS